MKCGYRFGKLIDAEAVSPLPVAGLIEVADFQDDLRQWHSLALVLDDVLEYGRSYSSHLEYDFRLGHFVLVFGLFTYRLDLPIRYDR